MPHRVHVGDPVSPDKSTLLAACKSIPQEYGNVRIRALDVRLPPGGDDGAPTSHRGLYDLADYIAIESLASTGSPLRPGGRVVSTLKRTSPCACPQRRPGLLVVHLPCT
jgi:hypothetical protein